MTTTEAIKQLQTEHDLIATERDLDGSQFAPALLEALAMAIEVMKCSEIPNCSEPKCADGCIYGWGSSECGHCDYRSEEPKIGDCISRQATITEIKNYERDSTAPIDYVKIVEQMPPAQPDARYINTNELIKRLQQAGLDGAVSIAVKMAGHERLKHVPSAQPERTCVNCGRTVNNGGWYADGRTRCPIEEHYALPKDGFCHLWEKRNITDDDYPERMEE